MLFFQNDISYGFSYNVKDDYSGTDFGHTESRHAENTEGEYYVLLPDGRVQTVKYNVDPYSGFVAEVVYEGQPKYDLRIALLIVKFYAMKFHFRYDSKPHYEYKPPVAPKPAYTALPAPKPSYTLLHTPLKVSPAKPVVYPSPTPTHALPPPPVPAPVTHPHYRPYTPVAAPSYHRPASYLPPPVSYHHTPYQASPTIS